MGKLTKFIDFVLTKSKKSEVIELKKKVMFQWSEAEPGAKVVLKFWPNSSLAVLIKRRLKVVLVKK